MNRILVYGTDWCIDCMRTKHFLSQHNINYEWIDIDQNPRAEEVVKKINNGMRCVPTIVFEDGSYLVEPAVQHLAEKLKNCY